MGMNVNLTPQLEELVRAKVASGLYTSASEVVREALRLMDEQDRLRSVKLEQLRDDIRQGLASGPTMKWSAAEVRAQARARKVARDAALDGAGVQSWRVDYVAIRSGATSSSTCR